MNAKQFHRPLSLSFAPDTKLLLHICMMGSEWRTFHNTQSSRTSSSCFHPLPSSPISRNHSIIRNLTLILLHPSATLTYTHIHMQYKFQRKNLKIFRALSGTGELEAHVAWCFVMQRLQTYPPRSLLSLLLMVTTVTPAWLHGCRHRATASATALTLHPWHHLRDAPLVQDTASIQASQPMSGERESEGEDHQRFV